MGGRARRVGWSAGATHALDEAVAYVAHDSAEAAVALLEEALDAAGSLATLSERGRMVPEIGEPTVREVFVQRYRLIYRVRAADVVVLAFLHGARDFDRWRRGQ